MSIKWKITFLSRKFDGQKVKGACVQGSGIRLTSSHTMSTLTSRAGPLGLLRGRKANDELSALRAQRDEERDAMQKLLLEQETENEKKEEAIRQLGEKFRRVQRGLNRLEKERKIATSSKERAEKENVHLRKLLQIRDKELQALNIQIAVAENSTTSNINAIDDKLDIILKDMTIPSSIDVPSVNVTIPENQVTKMMTNLELQLSLRDEHVDNLNTELKNLKTKMRDSLALERMLRESEGQQTFMKTQLERMERDYDEVMNAVTQCFESMKSMTINYKLKEAERNEIIWEANRCMVEQRALHLKNCKNMAMALHSMQVRLQELESKQPDKTEDGEEKGSVVALERLVLDNSRAAAFALKQMEHEREMKILLETHEKEKIQIYEENRQELDALHNTLLDKKQEISELREEISCQMLRLMNMSSEISRLQEGTRIDIEGKRDISTDSEIEGKRDTPMNIEIEEKRSADVDESAFSDAYDSELDFDRSLSEFDEASAPSIGKRKKTVAKALFSGSVNEDTSVTLETRSLHTLREEEDLDLVMLATKDVDVSSKDAELSAKDTELLAKVTELSVKEKELSELRLEKTVMLGKLSEAGEFVQRLERKVETEQATVNLLKTNLDMMEQVMIEKDRKIHDLMLDITQKEETLHELSKSIGQSIADADQDYKKDVEAIALQTELDVLKDKFKTESAIMQGMINVLNSQVYHAMKALEEEQLKNRSSDALPETTQDDVNDLVAALEQDLLTLHKKSQMALQLSQAEVAALKSKLEREPVSLGEPYTLGLDWLSPRKARNANATPPETPQR